VTGRVCKSPIDGVSLFNSFTDATKCSRFCKDNAENLDLLCDHIDINFQFLKISRVLSGLCVCCSCANLLLITLLLMTFLLIKQINCQLFST
jgi:hypothetical protein